MMEILAALLAGMIIGATVTYYVVQRFQHQQIIREYESQIQQIQEEHQLAIKKARDRSLDGSRAVIKGKFTEQLAPILPSFKYLLSDARFIGDPVDYIIFNGYTNIKDDHRCDSELELVVLDVKTGQASLSKLQQAIAKAIANGRVRFEVIRPELSGQQFSKQQSLSLEKLNETGQPDCPGKSYRIKDIRETYANAYKPWCRNEDEKLKRYYQQGMAIHDLAIEFQRKPGAIRSRLKKHGLLK